LNTAYNEDWLKEKNILWKIKKIISILE
jgi:hypothetical protein